MELDDESMRELYVPVGFAHGFCVLSEVADVLYKQTAYYDPAVERGIAWNDPDVGIDWPLPVEELIVSERDARRRGWARWPTSCPFSGILKAMRPRLERLRERTNGYTVTPAQYARVAYVALGALTLIVLSGAAVRLTGSGLGCPDWPKCYGNAYPPLNTHALIEFSKPGDHRSRCRSRPGRPGCWRSAAGPIGATWRGWARCCRWASSARPCSAASPCGARSTMAG